MPEIIARDPLAESIRAAETVTARDILIQLQVQHIALVARCTRTSDTAAALHIGGWSRNWTGGRAQGQSDGIEVLESLIQYVRTMWL